MTAAIASLHTLEIATGPQQWVGYWGSSAEASPQLHALVRGWANRDRWSISTPNPTHHQIAALSASGIAAAQEHKSPEHKSPEHKSPEHKSSDAWVCHEPPQLTLGRDGFGRVPLYWTQQGQTLWFSTRFQLLLLLSEKHTINPAALYGYSCFSYVPTPLTPVEAIASVPAGTSLTWTRTETGTLVAPQSRRLQDWREHPEQITDEGRAIAQLQQHLQGAIAQQIQDLSDDPVGVFLSGGLDSSVVAALLVQAGVKVRAYTLDLGQHSTSEVGYAEQVAQHLNIPLTTVAATPKQIRSAFQATATALDLPFGDGVTVPLYLLNQAASQEVRIIFNGEGGDQLFAGWTNKPLIAAGIYQTQKLAKAQSFEQQYLKTFHRLWGYEEKAFQPELYQQIQQCSPQGWLGSALDAEATPSLLHRLRRASLMLKGAQNIHPRATNLAFAHRLWVRSPFCDPALTDWTFRLAGELCLQGACEKYILKRAVEDWLPAEIVWRRKRGMGVPVTPWCLYEFWRDLGDVLNPGTLRAQGHWQPDLAKRVALGQLGGQIQGRRIGEVLWLMMMWQLWRSQILDKPANHHTWKHPFWIPYPIWRSSKQWFQ